MSEHTREAFARIFRYLPSLRTRPRTACAPPTPPERENGATRLARSDRNRRERARATPLTLPDTMRAAAQLWGAAGHVRSLKADFYSAGGQEIELYSCTPDIEITRRHALFSRI